MNKIKLDGMDILRDEEVIVSQIKINKDGTITVEAEIIVYTIENKTYSAFTKIRLKE